MINAADDIDAIYARLQELRGGEAVDVEWWRLEYIAGGYDVKCLPSSDRAADAFWNGFEPDPEGATYTVMVKSFDGWVDRLKNIDDSFAGLVFRERAAP